VQAYECASRNDEPTRHGCCLAIAELTRRKLLSPVRLTEVAATVTDALHYDVRKGTQRCAPSQRIIPSAPSTPYGCSLLLGNWLWLWGYCSDGPNCMSNGNGHVTGQDICAFNCGLCDIVDTGHDMLHLVNDGIFHNIVVIS
jgi:hypothetical protein